MNTQAKLTEATVEATITRADGRIEYRGVIAYTHRSPLKTLFWKLGQALKKKKGR